MGQIQPADPGARRRALLWVLAAALIGSALILLFEQHRERLQAWLVANPEVLYQHRHAVWVVLALLLVPLLGFCAYLWRFGARVIREQRVPPRGTVVIRPTPILQGQQAVRRGRLLRLMALLLGGSCAALLLLLWRLFELLLPLA